MSNLAKVQGHFKSNTRPYLKLPSCRATKTASDSIKKSMQKRPIFLWGVEVVIFGQSKNGEFSIKRHKTWRFHRSEPNFVLNEKLDHALSDRIVETDISHPHPPYGSKREKLLNKLWLLIVSVQNTSRYYNYSSNWRIDGLWRWFILASSMERCSWTEFERI